MDLQYLSDTEGNHTAVVIPIEEWNMIVAKHQDLKSLENPKKPSKKLKPSSFRGAISQKTADDLLLYSEKARTEWERNIS
ncbi:hypothetical protein GCM10011514_45870 [Emticicia aquatilis]|uniref:Prevent-host-death protein n=1 Tax=Emticicia aquatilis TaxID=1537369 RepID=A0A916Z692_9BACT|nr:hypothetical protein [Emticicia aquatilis]GGD76787.1 hypothetical protein GCM10011514_45870 [Emticicia aquatilis]